MAPEQIKKEDNYENLENVKFFESKIKSLLEIRKNDKNIKLDDARTYIYEMLTKRSSYVKITEGLKGEKNIELLQKFKPQRQWYEKTIEELEKFCDASGEYESNDNPSWFGINTRPEASKKEGIDFKTYTTIPPKEYAFIKNLPSLAKEFRKLSIDSDDIIQIKIPSKLLGFISHNDSVVVHFKKEENKVKIFEILNKWISENNITEEPREMNRTKFAADSSDTSFSMLIAQNITQWLEQNVDKYDSAILAKEAVKHAILQSQKPPVVKNKI